MLKNRSIPFGYCMVNGKYALNVPEAEAVRKIFADYIGGKSLKTIAVEMTIPYNTGKAVWNAELHAEVRQYIEDHEMTMAEFVTLALQDELHPKLNIQEGKTMGNMRTMAFQVPEELFQKIKDYLQRNNMTQKQFVIGLIENEIERDLRQHADMGEAPTLSEEAAEHTEQRETAAVSDRESVSEEVGKQLAEQENPDFSDDFDSESEESENPDEDEDLDESEDQDESEDMGMSMGM